MSKTFELTIRDGAKVLHHARANVADDFDRELLDFYLAYYPDAPTDAALFLRIGRGLFEGVMNNIAVAKAQRLAHPQIPAPAEFTIEGEEVRPPPPGPESTIDMIEAPPALNEEEEKTNA